MRRGASPGAEGRKPPKGRGLRSHHREKDSDSERRQERLAKGTHAFHSRPQSKQKKANHPPGQWPIADSGMSSRLTPTSDDPHPQQLHTESGTDCRSDNTTRSSPCAARRRTDAESWAVIVHPAHGPRSSHRTGIRSHARTSHRRGHIPRSHRTCCTRPVHLRTVRAPGRPGPHRTAEGYRQR